MCKSQWNKNDFFILSAPFPHIQLNISCSRIYVTPKSVWRVYWLKFRDHVRSGYRRLRQKSCGERWMNSNCCRGLWQLELSVLLSLCLASVCPLRLLLSFPVSIDVNSLQDIQGLSRVTPGLPVGFSVDCVRLSHCINRHRPVFCRISLEHEAFE